MDRRSLLKLLAAAALAGCSTPERSAEKIRVIVAGAGIVGASIAYHLARSGAVVTVVDKLGPATHASRGTFAWMNATWAKQPRHYHALSQAGVANWSALQNTLDLPIRWGGSLEWFDDTARQERLAAQISEQAQWGERARMVDRSELAVLEPNVEFGEARQAAFSENDGAIDPVLATRALLRAAENLGATIRYPCEITDVSLRNGRLVAVETSCGPIAGNRLVLATGAAQDAGRRFAKSHVPQRSTPGVIAITTPMARLLNRIVVAPGVHLHQRDDGRIVLGEQAGAPGNEAHALRLEGRPNDFPDRALAQQHAERLVNIAVNYLPGISEAAIESVYIGWRPLPIDGHPVLGAASARPDVYLAIMHSGVTLAPIVGQLVAHELTQNVSAAELAPFRPDRNFELVKRY